MGYTSTVTIEPPQLFFLYSKCKFKTHKNSLCCQKTCFVFFSEDPHPTKVCLYGTFLKPTTRYGAFTYSVMPPIISFLWFFFTHFHFLLHIIELIRRNSCS